MSRVTPSGLLSAALRFIVSVPQGVLIALIRLYQVMFSAWSGQRCRYYPSCSAYALTALRTHGAATGTALAASRIVRCNPWSRGGVDEVPPAPVESTVFLPTILPGSRLAQPKEFAA